MKENEGEKEREQESSTQPTYWIFAENVVKGAPNKGVIRRIPPHVALETFPYRSSWRQKVNEDGVHAHPIEGAELHHITATRH